MLTVIDNSAATRLTDPQRRELTQRETVIERHLTTADESQKRVAEELTAIRANRLYVEYGSFERYVDERWQKTRQWAFYQIAWRDVVGRVGQEITPAQARQLGTLPAELQKPAFEQAQAEGQTNGQKLRQFLQEMSREEKAKRVHEAENTPVHSDVGPDRKHADSARHHILQAIRHYYAAGPEWHERAEYEKAGIEQHDRVAAEN